MAEANCFTLVFWSWMEAAIRYAVEAIHSHETVVTICTTLLTFKEFQSFFLLLQYGYALRNDVSVNDGPHKRRWSHKIII